MEKEELHQRISYFQTLQRKDEIYQKLKEILLEEERLKQNDLEGEILKLQGEVSQVSIENKVEGFIDKKVEILKDNFAELSGPLVTASIKKQIRDNKDEMVNVLFPILGNMIQKYIAIELEKLQERIDSQIESTFSFAGIKREFLSLFGIKEKDSILAGAIQTEIEEAFIIFQNSGLVIAHYSKNQSVDQDLVAGMLTAIKQFVGTVFTSTGELNTIEFGNKKILIQSSYTYYVAVVTAGYSNAEIIKNILNDMMAFGSEHLSELNADDFNKEDIESKLKLCFNKNYNNANN